MANRRAIESVDTTLRDIMDTEQIFGGKVVVFGGDFRQTLPVIRYGKKEDFIEASLVKSPLIWPTIRRLKLVHNIRANEDPAFCEYLMKIGDGTEQLVGRDKIKIPSSFIIPCTNEDTSLDALFQSVYPNLTCFETDPYSLMSKAILTPKNEIADEINSILIDRFPGESKCYVSFDEPLDSKQMHCKDYLHTLSPAGLPPHKLILKKNCPIILLRNLNPSEGLCNGTRLVCDSFEDHLISCLIAVGEYKGKHVFILRIPLEPSKDENCPIPFKRTQFPIKICFAMTINKAQGQTLDFVGIYLKGPVFSHGQLYVAMSRAKKAESVKMIIFSDDGQNKLTNITNNIVYQEILEYISQSTVTRNKN
ncbi:ATP-dependent DNA helicase pif1-like isoform X5 [Ipomoea triloba]|uniref:ATP-dependent DNA helicase pif1-like isoform X5 n=1 Tax=Ipomoea triloba TaxID=35885 RepID=UPI00125DCBA2|nr:ATP-dependent DNA helicase pif1-like isoform X5 [Ipomoea triloba]